MWTHKSHYATVQWFCDSANINKHRSVKRRGPALCLGTCRPFKESFLFPRTVHWIQLFYLKQISSKCSEGTAGVCMRCSFDVCFALLSAGVGEWHWGLKDRALWSRCSFPSFPFPPSIPHIFLQTLVIISLLEWGYIKKRGWKAGRPYAQRTMKNPLCGCREEWNSNLCSVSTLCFERLWKFSQVETLLLSCKLQMRCIWSGWFIWAMRI